MRKSVLILLAVAALAACSSSRGGAVEDSALLSSESILSEAPVVDEPESFGTLSALWADHLRGCRRGWDFTISSLSRGAAQDAARLDKLFR